MFHPEPLGMLVTAGALLVLAHMVRTRRYAWWLAVSLGLLLGLGQLVRAWSLWMAVVAVVVLGVVAVIDRPLRRQVVTSLAVVVLLAVLVPAPWYVHQATRYSNPVFNRSQPDTFLLARRPVSFYVDAQVPEVVRSPWSGRFRRPLLARAVFRRRGATTSASGRGGPVERREPTRSTRRCRVRASSGCCRRLSRWSESWRFSASR